MVYHLSITFQSVLLFLSLMWKIDTGKRIHTSRSLPNLQQLRRPQRRPINAPNNRPFPFILNSPHHNTRDILHFRRCHDRVDAFEDDGAALDEVPREFDGAEVLRGGVKRHEVVDY